MADADLLHDYWELPLRGEPNPYDGMFQVVDAKGRSVCLGVYEQSDADLLAAAPELLRVAKAINEQIEDVSFALPADLEQQLEDVIAKAEGKHG